MQMQSSTFNPGFGIKMVELVYFFLSHRKLKHQKYLWILIAGFMNELKGVKVTRTYRRMKQFLCIKIEQWNSSQPHGDSPFFLNFKLN